MAPLWTLEGCIAGYALLGPMGMLAYVPGRLSMQAASIACRLPLALHICHNQGKTALTITEDGLLALSWNIKLLRAALTDSPHSDCSQHLGCTHDRALTTLLVL